MVPWQRISWIWIEPCYLDYTTSWYGAWVIQYPGTHFVSMHYFTLYSYKFLFKFVYLVKYLYKIGERKGAPITDR